MKTKKPSRLWLLSDFAAIAAMVILLYLITWLAGCAGVAQRVGPYGIRQCGQAFLVIAPTFSEAERHEIIAAARYWNLELQRGELVDGGSLDLPPAEGIISVVREDDLGRVSDGYRTCGDTPYKVNPFNGCVSDAVVHISASCLDSYNANVRQTLYRHELGHALGLSHSGRQWDLMAPRIDDDGHNPRELSDMERSEVLELYQ